MVDKDDSIDLDYVVLAALLAGTIASIATVASLLARPLLMDLGKKLPLPTINELFQPGKEEDAK